MKKIFKKENSEALDSRLKTRDLCALAVGGALMFALKMAMAFAPNIEPVTLLIAIFTLSYGWPALFSVGVYVLLEGVMFGFGFWYPFYLIIWPLLVVLVRLIAPLCRRSAPAWALALGAFGLGFGFLYAMYWGIIGGAGGFFVTWTAGLIFDVLHCVGNYALCLVLFKPLMRVMDRITTRAC